MNGIQYKHSILLPYFRTHKFRIIVRVEHALELFLDRIKNSLVVRGLLQALAQLLLQIAVELWQLIFDEASVVGLFEYLLDALAIFQALIILKAATYQVEREYVVA